jgi:hypothetical protein
MIDLVGDNAGAGIMGDGLLQLSTGMKNHCKVPNYLFSTNTEPTLGAQDDAVDLVPITYFTVKYGVVSRHLSSLSTVPVDKMIDLAI